MPKANGDVTTLDLFSEPVVVRPKGWGQEKKRAWKRAAYQRYKKSPEFRAKRLAKSREYHERNQDKINARARARYSAERDRERKRLQKERDPEAFLAAAREKSSRYYKRHQGRVREKRQSQERRDYMRQYNADNREKINTAKTATKHAQPAITAFNSAKHRAKDLGREFTLTKQWAADRYTGYCEMTGLAFVKAPNGKPWSYSPSIDRIDSAKGYTPENCRFVLWWVNRARGSDSDEIMNTIARAYAAAQFSQTDPFFVGHA